MKYTVDYFIKKFEAIPEDTIGCGSIKNKCSYWHCGINPDNYHATDEAIAFGKLLKMFDKKHDTVNAYVRGLHWGPIWLNDGEVPKYPQPTPKQRILAALYDIKKMQYPELSTTTINDLFECMPDALSRL